MAALPPVETPAPSYKLYSLGAITFASIVGSPLAGSMLVAENFERLGNAVSANRTRIAGAVGTALLFATAFLLPNNLTRSLGIATVLAARGVAQAFQGQSLVAHYALGGQRESGWKAFGIGLACAAGMLLTIALAAGLFPAAFPDEPAQP